LGLEAIPGDLYATLPDRDDVLRIASSLATAVGA
jgi:hypothetical protein